MSRALHLRLRRCWSLAAALIAASIATGTAATQLDPDERIDLELEGAPLVEILRSFASISGSRLDLEPGIEGLVTLELKSIPWRQALEHICADHRLDCRLIAGEPPVLRVRPGDPDGDATIDAPSAGAGDRLLGVRFFVPGASQAAEGTVRFHWAATVHTFDSGGDGEGQRWLARLSWVPFGPELEVVVPTLVRCAADGVESETLEPVRLPLAATLTRRWRGARLELSAAATVAGVADKDIADKDIADSETPPIDCGKGDDGVIRATFRPAGATSDADTNLDLAASPGTYLLVTPPAGDGRPAAAVLAVGTAESGERRVAVLRPDGGSGVTIERHSLATGIDVDARIPAPGGELELRLRFVDP